MIKIDSIKKLKKHLRDIAQYNDETFDFPDYRLKTIKRYDYKINEDCILVKPHVALKKHRDYVYYDENNVASIDKFDAYEFDNYTCNTEFIVSKDNPDKIVKVIFNNSRVTDEIINVQRLHKYVANLLDSSVEHNFEEVRDERPYNVRYETVRTSTNTDYILAQSKEDAIKQVTESYASDDNVKFTLLDAEELSLSESA